ncbi:MAG: homoserine dehydrogenase [Victivallales bacterium]|nr:homoserine dehydrogenase [Victivallales bacterium]
MEKLRIGVIGFGTVGAGVVETIYKNAQLMGERTGVMPEVTRIADLDTTTDRGITVPAGVLINDAMALIEDPQVDVVVELVGGTTIARKFVTEALKRGKSVVTANKALLAFCGKELFELASANGCEIYFEASVGGGIPCLKALREGLVANEIEEMYGILNGTCNYILTRMENERADFGLILKAAQEAGYAEANPSTDVDGYDTANKAAILASLAYGKWFTLDDVAVEGIRSVTLTDLEFAAELGYRIKLLAVIKKCGGKLQLSVKPTLVSRNSLLGNVSGVFNALWAKGDIVGSTMYYGRGAGRAATASAVVADLMDLALNRANKCVGRVKPFPCYAPELDLAGKSDICNRFYIRVQVLNQPGVLGRFAGILGDHGISVASVAQRENSGTDSVPMLVLTDKANQANMDSALNELRQESFIMEPPVCFAVEDMA